MIKSIFILSILCLTICTESTNFQANLHAEYGSPIQNYQNQEMMIQYGQPEINFNNNFNQNYELPYSYDQLPVQQPQIDEQNVQSNYFDLPSSDNIQSYNQNSGLEYNQFNTQNYNQNPSTELQSVVVEKSKEIPLNLISNPIENIGNLYKPDGIVSKPDLKFTDIQTLVKDVLWRNYLDTVQSKNKEIKNNKEDEITHNVNEQQNIIRQNSNLITTQNNKLEASPSNENLLNPHLNPEVSTQRQTEVYIPSSFSYNNQKFPQINPSRVHVNQFITQPTHQIPNSKFQSSIMNNLVNYQTLPPLPQTQYSNDFNNRIYPQLSTYTNRIPKVFNPQNTKTKITTKIYAYAAPEETEEEIKNELLKEITPRHHYKVIFIKTPHQLSRNSLKLIQKQAQNDEKTVIYVLSKKPDPSEIQEALDSVRKTTETKPQVHFIKYKTEEEANLAQHHIKAQYDNIGENEEILINPTNYHGTELIQNEINENRNYLPPV